LRCKLDGSLVPRPSEFDWFVGAAQGASFLSRHGSGRQTGRRRAAAPAGVERADVCRIYGLSIRSSKTTAVLFAGRPDSSADPGLWNLLRGFARNLFRHIGFTFGLVGMKTLYLWKPEFYERYILYSRGRFPCADPSHLLCRGKRCAHVSSRTVPREILHRDAAKKNSLVKTGGWAARGKAAGCGAGVHGTVSPKVSRWFVLTPLVQTLPLRGVTIRFCATMTVGLGRDRDARRGTRYGRGLDGYRLGIASRRGAARGGQGFRFP
jgi:hypothetical protein